MADKKSTKEAKQSPSQSLDQQLAAKRAELLVAQQGLGSTLQNPHRIKAIKKEIARILTQINAPKGDN
ncbi:50S ribosomal protein L29 [Candidatus Saccharibacteria bacterium]|nr:50S ribosomal protein L29 [Candidatus Saccharibacteria bacterium]